MPEARRHWSVLFEGEDYLDCGDDFVFTRPALEDFPQALEATIA
jgi:hypothetical protein